MRRTIRAGERWRAGQTAAERQAVAERIAAARADLDDGTPLRARHDGWTVERRTRFLEVLGMAGNVRDACRTVGMSVTGTYRMRRRSKAFARDWEAALARAAVGLEAVAYARAVEGVEEPVFQGGKLVGTRRRFCNVTLRTLLQASNPAKFGRMGHARLQMPDGQLLSLAEIEAAVETRVRAAVTAERAATGDGARRRLEEKLNQMEARTRTRREADGRCPECGRPRPAEGEA